MFLIIEKEKVHFNGILNGENVISEITRTDANAVYYNFKSENLQKIGTLKEIGNILNGEIDLNFITGGKLLQAELLKLEIESILKISLDWKNEDLSFRISIQNKAVLETDFYTNLISYIKSKGYPYYYKNEIVTIYVPTIQPEHLLILEADINVLIEKK